MPRLQTLIFFILLMLVSNSHASVPTECGEYVFRGTVDITKQGYVLYLNKGSRDQVIYKANGVTKENLILRPPAYRELTASLTQMDSRRTGTIEVKTIGFAVPDPLKQKYKQEFKLVKKQACITRTKDK